MVKFVIYDDEKSFRNNIKEGINMNINDKSYNDNIKLKMAKSSTSFYKK